MRLRRRGSAAPPCGAASTSDCSGACMKVRTHYSVSALKRRERRAPPALAGLLCGFAGATTGSLRQSDARGLLTLANRHPTRAVDLRLLRQIVKALLQDLLLKTDFDLGIYLVAAPEMTRLNEGFLQHQGSTDVITFDYAAPAQKEAALWGELIICLDEAVGQAPRFHTSWQSELVRYVI